MTFRVLVRISGLTHRRNRITIRRGLGPAACAVSQTLIDLYIAEEMTLEHLMAFTVTDDHAADAEATTAFGAMRQI